MNVASAAGLLLVLLLAPLVPGLANRTKSALTGRRGAPLGQPYADLARLWRKGLVVSRTTTAVFRATPVLLLATTLLAACLLPLDGQAAPIHFTGDLLAFAGLLAMGRWWLVLGALDTGSSFEGMGASREVTLASFAEPALLLCLTVLALATGDFRLQAMLGGSLGSVWHGVAPSLVLAAAGLFIVALAEGARVPVDDPATHLELTMIHEVMVLDHSGPDLALIEYAHALKMAVFGALVVRVLVAGALLPPAASLAVLVAGLALYAIAIGVVESVTARFRMARVPQLLLTACAVAGFGLILLMR